MSTIQDKINIIKDIFNTQNEELIIETLKTIHPIIITYYEMLDENFKNYMISTINDKLPTNFFDIDVNKDINIFIEIRDATFVCYAEKAYDTNDKIITKMINYYIKNNDINNLKIISNYMTDKDDHFDYDTVIEKCIKYNKLEALNFILMEYTNDFHDYDICTFEGYYSTFIMKHGDLIDIIKIFHEFLIKYPDFNSSHFNFNFNVVFNAALKYGREKCMHYALNNGSIDYYNDSLDHSNGYYRYIIEIFDFQDSIIFAIMGKNLNCIQIVFDIFKNQLDNNNWDKYFKFAAVYGTLDIIKYMITLKPYLVGEIENFYTNILQFALCEGNLEIVQFAINNGATYSVDMDEFIKEYNSDREIIQPNFMDDFIDYGRSLHSLPKDIDKRIEKCMQFIHNYN